MQRTDLRLALLDALIRLDESHRTVAALHFLEAKHIGTIARLAEVNEDEVIALIREGIIRLRLASCSESDSTLFLWKEFESNLLEIVGRNANTHT